jgi:hypothetical protein
MSKQDRKGFVITTLAVLVVLLSLLAPAQAQTYTQIHDFTGGETERRPMRA